jgi:hypothetical protein
MSSLSNRIVKQDNAVLIQDSQRDEAINIYDFEDFALFYIRYLLIEQIQKINSEAKFNLDANWFVKLVIDNRGDLSLHKPFSQETVILPYLPLPRLKKLLGAKKIQEDFKHVEMATLWKKRKHEVEAVVLEGQSCYRCSYS